MIFEDLVLDFLVKIKVVHSLPGRLRVHVPILKKVPREWQIDEILVKELFLVIDGVTSVEVCYITCNSLIKYDSRITNERQILKSIRHMIQIANKHRHEISETTLDQKDTVAKEFGRLIKKEFKTS